VGLVRGQHRIQTELEVFVVEQLRAIETTNFEDRIARLERQIAKVRAQELLTNHAMPGNPRDRFGRTVSEHAMSTRDENTLYLRSLNFATGQIAEGGASFFACPKKLFCVKKGRSPKAQYY
jgi:hypothetical protein